MPHRQCAFVMHLLEHERTQLACLNLNQHRYEAHNSTRSRTCMKQLLTKIHLTSAQYFLLCLPSGYIFPTKIIYKFLVSDTQPVSPAPFCYTLTELCSALSTVRPLISESITCRPKNLNYFNKMLSKKGKTLISMVLVSQENI